MDRKSLITVALMAFGVTIAAQTLPDLARLQGPGPVSRSRIRELAPPSFEDIVAKADLIVHGRAVATKTYLSDDQMHLYTDYVITPMNVLLQRGGASSPVPGAQMPIVLKQFGGQMTIQGVSVSDRDDDLPPLKSGGEVLLVLVYSQADGKYRLPGEIAGAFSVNGAQIAPLLRTPVKDERFNGMSLAQFASEVRRLRP